MVRLAIIEVDTTQVDAYNRYLQEEVIASIEKEPGVITLYAVAERAHSANVTLFETYADSSHYRNHLSTPHFQKYKQGTLSMVRNLDLVECRTIFYHRKKRLPIAKQQDLFIRLIKMEIDTSKAQAFNDLGQKVMLRGLETEPGVLVMYAVAEKKNPERISILEVYENLGAYQVHIKTPHFIQYKEKSRAIVKALQAIDVTPIALGAKEQR